MNCFGWLRRKPKQTVVRIKVQEVIDSFRARGVRRSFSPGYVGVKADLPESAAREIRSILKSMVREGTLSSIKDTCNGREEFFIK